MSLPLDGKTVLWLSEFNKYIVTETPFDKIIELIYTGKNQEQILEYCIGKLNFSPDNANQIIKKIKLNLEEIQSNVNMLHNEIPSTAIPPATFNCKRYYEINGIIFLFEYETDKIEFLIHPKFAHLEIPATLDFINHFQVFKAESEIILVVDGKTIGNWPKEMEHFMTGKVSMEILQKIYGNEENDWMAVFHASAITNGKESIMFLGDSGNGKSTIAAILMASGLHLLADDFVPVDAKSGKVYNFPAALSVKKKALDLLIPLYPQLALAKEFYYKGLDKTVRYLPALPFPENNSFYYPCRALIFVKFKKDSGFKLKRIPKDEAFKQLIPDSWISPLPENALFFLNWFIKLPCYQITYSDNVKMVNTIKNLFQDDL